jgi:hypothetical protein
MIQNRRFEIEETEDGAEQTNHFQTGTGDQNKKQDFENYDRDDAEERF